MDDLGRLRALGPARWDAIQDHGRGPPTGVADKLSRGGDCLKIVDSRTARDQNQPRRLRGFQGSLLGSRRRVDQDDIGPLLPGCVKNMPESARLSRDDHRRLGFSPVPPVRGRGLWIKVDNSRSLSLAHCLDG